VGEDPQKNISEAEQRDEDAEVEGHSVKPNIKPAAEAAATEEGPDVEGHSLKPNVKP
jgi:hypothetical protein